MNKNKKKFSCPYCGFEFPRGSRGYGNHFRAAHPKEYSRGLKLYGSSLSSATWDKIDLEAEASYNHRYETEIAPALAKYVANNQVSHPPHYGGADDPYEAIKVIHAWGLGFDLGNVLKYIRRADLKGTPIQDLEKAKFYLEDEIQRRKEVANG